MKTQHLLSARYGGQVVGLTMDYVFTAADGGDCPAAQPVGGIWARMSRNETVYQQLMPTQNPTERGLNRRFPDTGYINVKYNDYRLPMDILDALQLSARVDNSSQLDAPFAAVRPSCAQTFEDSLLRLPAGRQLEIYAEIPEALGSERPLRLTYRLCVVEMVKERVRK